MGKLREYVKANFKEESQRRYILKTAAAEAFAEERVLTQKEIEEIIKGDINGDGVFDIVDLTILNKHLTETQRIIDSKWLIAADLNKDGKIDIVDLSILNKKINK